MWHNTLSILQFSTFSYSKTRRVYEDYFYVYFGERIVAGVSLLLRPPLPLPLLELSHYDVMAVARASEARAMHDAYLHRPKRGNHIGFKVG